MQVRNLSVFPLAALAILTTASASAQQVPSKDVQIYLVANDKGNKPVADLKPGDVAVTDNSQPVTLTDLKLVDSKPGVDQRITLLFNRPGFDPAQKASIGNSQQAAKQLRDQAAKFLKPLPAEFQISVMDVWGRLQLEQEFTSDRKSVADGVTAAVQPGQIGVAVAPNPLEQKLEQTLLASANGLTPEQIATGNAISSAIVASANLVNNQQMPSGLAGLLALAQAEQGLKGRKAIVYFTYTADLMASGTDPAKVRDAIQTIVGSANRSGVSIYVVSLDNADSAAGVGKALGAYSSASSGSSDPGLLTPSTSSGSTGGTNGNGYNQAKAGQFGSAAEFRYLASRQDNAPPIPGSLDSLVRGTGGFAFSGDEGFVAPVKQISSDLTTYYIATYVPSADANDGKFHPVEIKPVRPGLKLRAPTGYIAPALNAK